ncbi:EF-P 5-aminopentanol modification-associated protein YfmF [Paratissierella segnis]|uniref:Insulinase family protein n=1 Tax=Paratissierella segnis TaxID=2763679 RepID=A0A926ILB6_9FIRM|nr:insulinase family protein [Paratissierella segnis]MBC8588508.1 insulinase family protein [Paratissierella segnis]
MDLKVDKIKLGNGINLNLIYTDKFKSNLLSYYIVRPLNREDVTKNALLPLVLKRGNQKLNTTLEVEQKLDELYGSNLSLTVNKRGEKHVIRFTLEWADGSYFNDDSYNLKTIDLLNDIVFNPYLENDSFSKEYVRQEKENLKDRIEGKINSKRSYAVDRCIEEMCKSEAFSLYSFGYVEDLPSIDEKNLYEHYKNVINNSPIEIIYVGKYDEKLISHIKESNKMNRQNIIYLSREKIDYDIEEVNVVRERLDVNQGKLVLGYRTGIPFEENLYNGLLIASDILGGGPNSKLFRHVREENSLAYYIGSMVIKYKSILLIDGGIEFENYDKTTKIINEQIEKMRNGDFSDDDIEISKKAIKASTESIKDSTYLISEFFFSQQLSNDFRSLEEVLNDIDNVNREDIIEASRHIALDTIYFMSK